MNDGMAYKQEALREMALFAGAGGGILGGKLLGWECVCAVEWEPYPASVLMARQNEGFLPPFPIWDDVRTFDGKPWRGIVDVVSGGFPCQDISSAGKGAGITGERSGMWKHMARIIGEVRPQYAFVENSPILTSRGLDVVLGDLAALGYDAEWGVYSAADFGDCHLRERLWICAGDPDRIGSQKSEPFKPVLAEKEERRCPQGTRNAAGAVGLDGLCGYVGPHIAGKDAMLPEWVDRFKAIGNAQHCGVVRLAWHTLHGRIMDRNELRAALAGE
jgi:DNA (cytosine-5)-methyltransferase 1